MTHLIEAMSEAPHDSGPRGITRRGLLKGFGGIVGGFAANQLPQSDMPPHEAAASPAIAPAAQESTDLAMLTRPEGLPDFLGPAEFEGSPEVPPFRAWVPSVDWMSVWKTEGLVERNGRTVYAITGNEKQGILTEMDVFFMRPDESQTLEQAGETLLQGFQDRVYAEEFPPELLSEFPELGEMTVERFNDRAIDGNPAYAIDIRIKKTDNLPSINGSIYCFNVTDPTTSEVKTAAIWFRSGEGSDSTNFNLGITFFDVYPELAPTA